MSVRQEVPESTEEDSKEWLMTYADMITLLLAFFILLLAISTMDLPRFQETMGAIKSAMNKRSLPTVQTRPTKVISQIVGVRQRNMINEINRAMEGTPEGVAVNAQFDRNRVLITINSQALFGAGRADLVPAGRKILDGVAKVLEAFPEYDVDIRGHTDDTSINTPQFPSNWELSAVRATSTLRYLLSKGIPAHRMTATGLADIDPLAPNDSQENRMANRRVEFVLEKKR